MRLIYLDVCHVDPILATTSWSNLVGSEFLFPSGRKRRSCLTRLPSQT